MFNKILFSVVLTASPNQMAPSLQPVHAQVVQKWLCSHPGYKIATELDCGNCTEQIDAIRHGMGGAWKPVPNYQPYYIAGDFNMDRRIDFAIAMVAPSHKTKPFVLLVFNGPFAVNSSQKPAFVSEPMDLRGQGLFFGPPRQKPYRLLVGGFESEGLLLLPKGKSYVWDQSSHDD